LVTQFFVLWWIVNTFIFNSIISRTLDFLHKFYDCIFEDDQPQILIDGVEFNESILGKDNNYNKWEPNILKVSNDIISHLIKSNHIEN
jgi:hypothetical protein